MAIGFDIGGSSARAAVMDRDARVVDSAKIPTPGSMEVLLEWARNCCIKWNSKHGAAMPMGVGLPGVVDSEAGVCVRCINLPWLERQPVADLLEHRIGRRPVLVTDAQAATWGEYVAADKPIEPFAHLRLGTGIACCVVINGQLLPTDPMRRTHWPMLVVEESADAPFCPCGLRGCLELFSGGKALTENARLLGFDDLRELAGKGQHDSRVASLVDHSASRVVVAIRNLKKQLGVQAVTLGGGVIESLPALFERVQARFESADLRVRKAVLGDHAGVTGAALAAQMQCLSGKRE